MSERRCMPFLILESVEEDLNYLLESSNMILHPFFAKLVPEEKWGKRGTESRAYTIASTNNYLVQITSPLFATYFA
jgi:hypothetical protein